MDFLSERSIEVHKEYLNNLMLKYKIFEKSYPELSGCDIEGIYKARIPRSEREAAGRLFCEIMAHRIFFSSFASPNTNSMRIKREYGSVAAFLYKICEVCREARSGFLFVYEDKGKVKLSCTEEYEDIFRYKRVLLAIDICEHSYFLDYGFNKDGYVINASRYLDLSKIEKSQI